MTHHACLEMTFRRSAKSYNVKTCLVALKVNFSPIVLQSLVLNLIIDCFSFIKKVFDAFGFPVIMFSLRFTTSRPRMSEPSYLVPGDLLEILSLPWHLEVCAECSKVQGDSAN